MRNRSATVAEKIWMKKIIDLDCIVCLNNGVQNTPAGVHHLLGTTKKGCHFLTIPLCYHHHTGKFGLHKNYYKWKIENGSQWVLLQQVYKIIEQDIPCICRALEAHL